jgi:hypothetical protein
MDGCHVVHSKCTLYRTRRGSTPRSAFLLVP